MRRRRRRLERTPWPVGGVGPPKGVRCVCVCTVGMCVCARWAVVKVRDDSYIMVSDSGHMRVRSLWHIFCLVHLAHSLTMFTGVQAARVECELFGGVQAQQQHTAYNAGRARSGAWRGRSRETVGRPWPCTGGCTGGCPRMYQYYPRNLIGHTIWRVLGRCWWPACLCWWRWRHHAGPYARAPAPDEPAARRQTNVCIPNMLHGLDEHGPCLPFAAVIGAGCGITYRYFILCCFEVPALGGRAPRSGDGVHVAPGDLSRGACRGFWATAFLRLVGAD